MTDVIFKRFDVPRKDIFDTIINEMLRVGWQQLNIGHSKENEVYVMFSNGVTGDKNIYMELIPYSGRDTENISNRYQYDIRKTDYAEGYIKWGTGYDASSARLENRTPGLPMGLVHGMSYSTATNPNIQIDKNAMHEVYLYADKDRIMFAVVEPEYIGNKAVFTYLGLPDELYLKDKNTHHMKSLVRCSTSWTGNQSRYATCWIQDRPDTIPSNKEPYVLDVTTYYSSKNPSTDGEFSLFPFYIERTDEGMRGKLGGVYSISYIGHTTQVPNIVHGDILEIETEGGVHKYKYLYCKPNYGGFPVNIAFRVE